MKFARFTFFVLFAFFAVSCGKVKALKSMGENLSNITETAKTYEGMQNAEEAYDAARFTMSEGEVRDFYRAVERLMKKHPTVHFEIPYGSAVEAMEAGINLKKTIESETDYGFEKFNEAALAIFAVRTQGIGSEFVSAVESSRSELENFDVEELEGLDDEQRAAIEASIEAQQADLENVASEIDTEEMQKIREHYDMVMRVRSEFVIPD